MESAATDSHPSINFTISRWEGRWRALRRPIKITNSKDLNYSFRLSFTIG